MPSLLALAATAAACVIAPATAAFAAPAFAAPAPHLARPRHLAAPAPHLARPRHLAAPAPHLARPRHLARLAAQERPADRETVAALNKLYFAQDAPAQPAVVVPAPPISGGAVEPEVLPNLPLWRVQWAALPGVREGLHVHQPLYTSMFEQVISGPRPWLFGHVLLPGGSAVLNAPASSLNATDPAAAAPRVGCLMEILGVQRLGDGRLLLSTQAVGRILCVRQVRSIPYNAADCLVLPDHEDLAAYDDDAEARAGWSAAAAAAGARAWTAAAAAGALWRPYEFGTSDVPNARYVAQAAVLAPVAQSGAAAAGLSAEMASSRARALAQTDAERWDEGGDASARLAGYYAGDASGDVIEAAARVAALEERVWETLAALADATAALAALDDAQRRATALPGAEMQPLPENTQGGASCLPRHLLALQPPPRDGGTKWSTPFGTELQRRPRGWPVQPAADTSYPALRRASRLTYALAGTVLAEVFTAHGGKGMAEGRQAFLEVPSIAERLNLVLGPLEAKRQELSAQRALRESAPGNGSGSGSGKKSS